MNRINSSGWMLFFRVYPVFALIAAAALLSPAYLALALPALALYVYVEMRLAGTLATIPTSLFILFSLTLLLSPLVGPWLAVVFALPMLPVLDHNLQKSSLKFRFTPRSSGSRLTRPALMVVLSVSAVAFTAWALGNWQLLVLCALILGYLSAVLGVALRRSTNTPLSIDIIEKRVMAAQPEKAVVRLKNRASLGGQIRIASVAPWASVTPSWIAADGEFAEIEIALTAPQAGPEQIYLSFALLDSRGLLQTSLELKVADLLVVPRARYAEWLARRYLATSKSGTREAMTSSPANLRTTRKGIEFYGIRSYQPGDSLKTIDWKHSMKLHQMVVREFLDSGIQSSIMLVNLSACDENDKDKLAYDLVMTALTLARESIPSVVAAYDERKVVLTTRLIDPRQALLQALNLMRDITMVASPERFLQTPDVIRLKANIRRLSEAKDESYIRLRELLKFEYAALGRAAKDNPANEALEAALAASRNQANVLIISRRNHDAEALSFATQTLTERGFKVLTPELAVGR